MATSPEQGIGSGAGTGDGVTDVLPGFNLRSIPVGDGVVISVHTAGRGPAVLLMHGYPQTSSAWHAVAPRLAERFTVVAPDLRDYGDSSRPASDESQAAYSKRRMALDQVEVMRQLGHPRFAVVGHDRGGRVAHRMARDHAGAVERVAILDIAPTATMYARTDREFATRYFWWFFLIQPNGLPERLIGHDVEFFLREQSIAGAEPNARRAGGGVGAGIPPLDADRGRCPRRLRGLPRRGGHRPGARHR